MIAFEWDPEKARANVQKHGVAFEEARSCFYDPRQIAFYDPDHSNDEDRELLIASYWVKGSLGTVEIRPAQRHRGACYE